MSWVAAGAAVVSIGAGIYKDSRARKDAKAARSKRTPYKTPKEALDYANTTKAMAAQGGFDPFTQRYLTEQNDQGFNTSLNAAQRLGGDPNLIQGLLQQKFNNEMQIGQKNQLLLMDKIGKMFDAQKYLASNADAEWASQEGMIKDEQAAAQQRRLEASQQISQGVNMGISAYSNYKTGQLYQDKPPSIQPEPRYVAPANPELATTASAASLRATTGLRIGG